MPAAKRQQAAAAASGGRRRHTFRCPPAAAPPVAADGAAAEDGPAPSPALRLPAEAQERRSHVMGAVGGPRGLAARMHGILAHPAAHLGAPPPARCSSARPAAWPAASCRRPWLLAGASGVMSKLTIHQAARDPPADQPRRHSRLAATGGRRLKLAARCDHSQVSKTPTYVTRSVAAPSAIAGLAAWVAWQCRGSFVQPSPLPHGAGWH